MFVVFHALLFMRITSHVKHSWDKAASLKYDQLQALLQNERPSYSSIFITCARENVTDIIEFHAVRRLFILSYGLSEDFDFAKYLRKSITHEMTTHLEIKHGSWLILLAGLFMYAVYIEIRWQGNSDEVVLDVSYMWFLFVISMIVLTFGCILLTLSLISRSRLRHFAKCGDNDQLENTLHNAFHYHTHSQTHLQISCISRLLTIASSESDKKKLDDEYCETLFPELFVHSPKWIVYSLDLMFLFQCFFFALSIIISDEQAFQLFDSDTAIIYVVLCSVAHLVVTIMSSSSSYQHS
jgi:hypothetical protein